MSVGKLTTSFASASSEPTLALANLNLDFSLLRVEAPKEFTELGAALSVQRRTKAEDGQPHQTARRLGALFEQIVPPIPNLIRAYGKRASQISGATSDKSKSAKGEGPLSGYAGADGTSIWAAATSGAPAIATHLLACMLARTWSPSEGTSIWVEIVSERIRMIESTANDSTYPTSLLSLVAARQGLARTDLAQWDASARAWLQAADDAKSVPQKQLMLILNNLNLPVNLGKSTYENVIEAWQNAMTAVEHLVLGQPQRATKGASLLGLAAWHLFPDLIVLTDKVVNIKFQDELVAPGGILTVGLETAHPDKNDGIYWSLSLSHLKYYGEPVFVSRSTSRDSSRLSIEQVQFLAFGCMLSRWGSMGQDPLEAARALLALWDRMQRITPEARVNLQRPARLLLSESSWLYLLVDACRTLLGPEGVDRDIALSIVALGRRRGQDFLARRQNHCPPMFGLANTFTTNLLVDVSLQTETSRDVVMMRVIAHQLRLTPEQCIIRIRRPAGSAKKNEYVTAVQHEKCFGPQGGKRAHRRWIETSYRSAARGCSCAEDEMCCLPKFCECIRNGTICSPKCHSVDPHVVDSPACNNLRYGEVHYYTDESLFPNISPPMNSTACRFVSQMKSQSIKDDVVIEWPTFKDRSTGDLKPSPRYKLTDDVSIPCECYFSGSYIPQFMAFAGNPDGVALFVDPRKIVSGPNIRQSLRAASSESWISADKVTEILKSEKLSPECLIDYMVILSTRGTLDFPDLTHGPNIRTLDVSHFVKSLKALALATEIYKEIPSASIAIEVMSNPLCEAHWTDALTNSSPVTFAKSLTRPYKLACIAMLESGLYNLRPQDLEPVFGISARNTLYVSKALLEDPSSVSNAEKLALVFGNVGRSGMALLVSPQALRVRKVDLNMWMHVTHATFDGKFEDAFQATTLHLSFTGYELPLNTGNQGAIDNELSLLETLVSVHDHGKWVADIDPLAIYKADHDYFRRIGNCNCGDRSQHGFKAGQRGHFSTRLTSLDSWEELLDSPADLGTESIGIVRASGNALARLAAACVSVQLGFRTVLLASDRLCLRCITLDSWRWKIQQGTSEGPTFEINATARPSEKAEEPFWIEPMRRSQASQGDEDPSVEEANKEHAPTPLAEGESRTGLFLPQEQDLGLKNQIIIL